MPRKKKEEKEESINIDIIAKKLKKDIDDIKDIDKLDGITLEIELKDKNDIK